MTRTTRTVCSPASPGEDGLVSKNLTEQTQFFDVASVFHLTYISGFCSSEQFAVSISRVVRRQQGQMQVDLMGCASQRVKRRLKPGLQKIDTLCVSSSCIVQNIVVFQATAGKQEFLSESWGTTQLLQFQLQAPELVRLILKLPFSSDSQHRAVRERCFHPQTEQLHHLF